MLLLATIFFFFKNKIPDVSNAKEYYLSFLEKKQQKIDGTIKNIYTRTKKFRRPKDY